jgi:hypothetical protein
MSDCRNESTVGWLKQQTVDGYVEYRYVVAYLVPDSHHFWEEWVAHQSEKPDLDPHQCQKGSESASKSKFRSCRGSNRAVDGL